MRLIPPFDNRDRVNRGGSWSYYPSNARVANRSRDTPGSRNNDLGFRLCRSL